MHTLVRMKALAAAAVSENHTEAAAKLGIPRKSFTSHISALEKTLGGPLTFTTENGLNLTEMGLKYHQYCAQIIELERQSIEQIAALKSKYTGRVRLKVVRSIWQTKIQSLVGRFLETHPEVRIEVTTEDNEKARKPFDRHDIVIATHIESGIDILKSVLFDYRLALCASKSYITKFGMPSHLSSYTSHQFVGEAPSPNFGRSTLDTNDCASIKQAAILGYGLAQLPLYYISQEIGSKKLILIQESEEPQKHWMHIACADGQHERDAANALVRFIRAAF